MIVLVAAIKPTFNRLETSVGFLSDDDHKQCIVQPGHDNYKLLRIYPTMIDTCPENFTLPHPPKLRDQKYQQKIEKMKWALNHQ